MVGEWDVDKLEKDMPMCAIVEWNDYLDWDLTQITKAVLGAVPAARAMGDGAGRAVHLTRPEDIGGLFDALNVKG